MLQALFGTKSCIAIVTKYIHIQTQQHGDKYCINTQRDDYVTECFVCKDECLKLIVLDKLIMFQLAKGWLH